MIAKKVLLMFTLAASCSVAMACDAADPRCTGSTDLVETLKYREAIAELQMGCRGRATVMHPETLEKSSPAVLMGIVKDTDSWRQLIRAYDMYVDEACGGNEIVFLLVEAYRVGWDRRLAGNKLSEGLKTAKAMGKEGLQDDAKAVSAEVNRVIGPIIVGMERLAKSNYLARIKGAVTGEALEVEDGASCMPQ